MAASLDVREIGQLVQAFGPERNDRLVRLGLGVATPGQVPPIVNSYNRVRYTYSSDEDPELHYTRNASSSAATSSASVTASSRNSSFFWGHQPADRNSAGVTSQSEAAGPYPNFTQTLQQPAVDIPSATPRTLPANPYFLWCELCALGDCNEIFNLNQTYEWIQHHAEHLRNDFPDELMCWFCNHVKFKAANRADRYATFVDRMEHIRQHVFDEYRTVDDMRPDFRMIVHLHDRRLISDNMFDRAMSYTELPDAYRLPGSAQGQQQPGHHGHERRPAGPGLAHNLDRERRHQRQRGSRVHANRSTRH